MLNTFQSTDKEQLETIANLYKSWSGPVWLTNGRNDGPWEYSNVVNSVDPEFHFTAENFERFNNELTSRIRCTYCGRIDNGFLCCGDGE